MKKIVFALTLVLVMTMSSASVFARDWVISPVADDDASTEKAENAESDLDETGSNVSTSSPQTGMNMTYLYIALVSAAGVAVVSAKNLAEEK